MSKWQKGNYKQKLAKILSEIYKDTRWGHVFHYRASITVTVTWFTVNVSSCLLEDESVSTSFLPRQNPGFFGNGNVAVSLLNIKTTDDITGLSSACSWTHKRPTWMHLNTSYGAHDSLTDESISPNPFPSLHSLHAYTHFDFIFLVIRL